METYNLNKENKSLVQKPEMKEPEKFPTLEERFKNNAEWDEYKEHIASLKTYDISGIVPESWETGRDILASEFEVKELWYNPFPDSDTKAKRDFAVPIVQPIQEVEHCNANSQYREEREAQEVEVNNEDEETPFQLLLSVENALNNANKLSFGERLKAKQKILEIISIQRKVKLLITWTIA